MYILMTTGLFVQHVMPAVLICMIASVATMTDACLYLVLLFEIETKLIVLGKAPQLIMEEIATHGVFGKHCRMPAGVIVFQDISHDTPARSLSGRGIALHPRKKQGQLFSASNRTTHGCSRHGHQGGTGASLAKAA